MAVFLPEPDITLPATRSLARDFGSVTEPDVRAQIETAASP